MSTALIVIFVIVAALAACGALSWKLYEINEGTAFNRVRYEQHVGQLRVALQASEAKLALIREAFESPTGVAARVGAQQELATAIRTYAPHLPTRYRHTLSSLQANEKFFLSLHKAVPDLFSDAIKTRLDKHKPIRDDFFEIDKTDLIAEAGVLLLRARDVLSAADAPPAWTWGPSTSSPRYRKACRSAPSAAPSWQKSWTPGTCRWSPTRRSDHRRRRCGDRCQGCSAVARPFADRSSQIGAARFYWAWRKQKSNVCKPMTEPTDAAGST